MSSGKLVGRVLGKNCWKSEHYQIAHSERSKEILTKHGHEIGFKKEKQVVKVSRVHRNID